MTAEERAVLTANEAFYTAFAERDPEAMDRVWARRVPVACIHPGWNPLRGREPVMASWRAIFSGPGSPQISCSRATAYVTGDSAVVICVEHVPGSLLVATNLFAREDGEWRMIHHHAGGLAEPLDDVEPPHGTVH
jgi:ketosteroid isomerase-like protein